MKQALDNKPITVFGDGSQTRSFCYVDDQVEGLVRLLMSNYHGPVNIGNPDEVTIADFAEEIIALTGSSQPIVYEPLPVDDPKQRRPDISIAEDLLGWSPQVRRADGLRRTLDYFRSLPSRE
jgi:dTDP-glucose 4,6-dehydratase